jgi:hypothetical protein
MNDRHQLLFFFLLGAAFWPACQACSNAEQSPAEDAAADHAGGSGGMGGMGGMPWTGGSSGSGSSGGGSGGSAGTGGTGGSIDAGPQPLWEEIGESTGVSFDRVTNPQELRLFRWAPCKEGSETVDGCEIAEFLLPAFYGDKFEVNPATVVHDNGSQVFTGIVFTRNTDFVIVFTDGEGHVQEAFRARRGSEPAAVTHPAIWGSRYALLASRNSEDLKKDGKHPGVFGTFGSQPPQVVTMDTWTLMPFGQGVVRSPMGESRWLWDWSPHAGFVSFSSHDGSDARVIYRQYEHPEVWNIGVAVSTGTHFLFAEDLPPQAPPSPTS